MGIARVVLSIARRRAHNDSGPGPHAPFAKTGVHVLNHQPLHPAETLRAGQSTALVACPKCKGADATLREKSDRLMCFQCKACGHVWAEPR